MKQSKKHAIKQFAISIAAVVLVSSLPADWAAQDGSAYAAARNDSFSEEEYEKLRALQWDGYEEMSIYEYQKAVWTMTDTEEYRNLLERFSKSEAFYACRDYDETAAFFFSVLEALTAGDDKWRTREFGGYTVSSGLSGRSASADHAGLEFVFTLTILDAKRLTVGEYNAARTGMTDGMRALLRGRTDAQLQDEALMRGIIDTGVERLTGKWGSGSLQITAQYAYMPLCVYESGGLDGSTTHSDRWNGNGGNISGQEQERREYPNGTQEDYRSLLALKTPDYQEMRLADFNRALLEWANENHERMERINCDVCYHDFAVSLTEEELLFVTLSVELSGLENAKAVQSHYTGRAAEDPCVNQYLPEKLAEKYGRSAWCDLFYQFSYHIADQEALTVGERDRLVGGMINTIREFWDEIELEELLGMKEAERKTAIVEILQEIADSYSTRQLTIHIREDGVSCECMDERSVFEEQNSLQEPLAQERSAAYKKLLKYKTEDYLQQSVAAFNASIAPTGDAFGEALDAYAQVAAEGIDAEDENYEFLKVTLQASLSELYCEVFVDDTPYFPVYLSRMERPYAYMGPTGWDMFYEFMFFALVNVSYRVTSPETLTVEERDRVLRTCREELQSYVDSLSEDEMLNGNIKAALTRKAQELAFRYSGGGMELSIEIGNIDMFDM